MTIRAATCIADAREREAEGPRYFYEFGPNRYTLGSNVVLYALSHRRGEHP